MTEFDDTEGTENAEAEESSVITDLRRRNKELDKELKEFRRRQAEEEAAASTRRAESVRKIVDTFGLPNLADDVTRWVEGDITEDTVREALQARGIPLSGGDGQQETSTTSAEPKQSASNVGQRVADAAGGTDRRSLDERINAAESQAELVELMREAELVRNYN